VRISKVRIERDRFAVLREGLIALTFVVERVAGPCWGFAAFGSRRIASRSSAKASLRLLSS